MKLLVSAYLLLGLFLGLIHGSEVNNITSNNNNNNNPKSYSGISNSTSQTKTWAQKVDNNNGNKTNPILLQGENAHDLFGWSVALSKDASTLAVGAIDNDSNGSASGQVRVFQVLQHEENSNNRVGVVSLFGDPINGVAAGDYHGYAVALSENGSIVAIGAPDHQQSTGMVRVYSNEEQSSSWIQFGQSIVGDAPGDGLGHILALSDSGHTLVIGAPYHKENTGLVRVFQYHKPSHSWRRMGQNLLGDARGVQFGYSVAISKEADILAVGSKNHPSYYYTDFKSNSNSVGQVQSFQWSSTSSSEEEGSWKLLARPLYGIKPGDYFGFAISLSASGSIMAVGNPYLGTIHGKDAGKVQIYSLLASCDRDHVVVVVVEEEIEDAAACNATFYKWMKLGPDLLGHKAGDYFGYSVSLSANGDRIAIGARQANELSGEVQIFDLQASFPAQIMDDDSCESHLNEYVPIGSVLVGKEPGDQSGFSVSLSADGRTVGVGSPYHDAPVQGNEDRRTSKGNSQAATTTRMQNAGQVRIFYEFAHQRVLVE